MANYGEKINEIMKDEREKTVKIIEQLPAELHNDAFAIFCEIQNAINNWIGQQDRAIDGRLLHAITGIMSDEANRIFNRLNDAGLLYPRKRDDN